MNTIERRVSVALHEHVDDVPISAKDLAQLQRELHRRARAPQARHRRSRGSRVWQLAVAACALTGVVLGALALRSGPEPPKMPAGPAHITNSDLAGIWRNEQFPGLMWTFSEYGVSGTHDSGGLFTGGPDWTVVPGAGSLTLHGDAPRCDLHLRTTITPDGRMSATVTRADPTCPFLLGEVADFTRVSPISLAGSQATSLLKADAPARVTRPEQLRGAWLLRGTGEVLTISTAGSYEIHDLGTAASAQQAGLVAVARDGSVVFSPMDAPGCTTVYESVISRGNRLDASLADDSCDRLGATTDTWTRLTED
jgi:hypothetical protein